MHNKTLKEEIVDEFYDDNGPKPKTMLYALVTGVLSAVGGACCFISVFYATFKYINGDKLHSLFEVVCLDILCTIFGIVFAFLVGSMIRIGTYKKKNKE